MATWVQDVVKALQNLGGIANLTDGLYAEIEKISDKELSKEWRATVRNAIETHSSNSDNFRGKDLFESVAGTGARKGYWRLREFPGHGVYRAGGAGGGKTWHRLRRRRSGKSL